MGSYGTASRIPGSRYFTRMSDGLQEMGGRSSPGSVLSDSLLDGLRRLSQRRLLTVRLSEANWLNRGHESRLTHHSPPSPSSLGPPGPSWLREVSPADPPHSRPSSERQACGDQSRPSSSQDSCLKGPGPSIPAKETPVLNFTISGVSSSGSSSQPSRKRTLCQQSSPWARRCHSSATSNRAVGGIWPEGSRELMQA